jgi:hypothetical protein
MRQYQHFDVRRRSDHLTARLISPRERRGEWLIAVNAKGVAVNGDYGTNPSRAEMEELVELMRECVAKYDELRCPSAPPDPTPAANPPGWIPSI